MKTFRVNVVVLLIWLASAFLSSTFVWNSDLFYISISPVTWTLAVGNFVVYLKIFLVVRRHHSQIHLQQQGRNRTNLTSVKRLKKSTFNTFLVFILLVCCYLPYSLYLADVDIPYSMVVTMFFLNSSLNPLVYCWRVRDLRSAMKRILSSCLKEKRQLTDGLYCAGKCVHHFMRKATNNLFKLVESSS